MNDGIVIIDKPLNFTSRDIVNIVGKKLHTKKVGHCGTLDPLASGVLILCVGNATKLAPYLTNSNKVYRTKMILGTQTSTGDMAGEIIVDEKFNCEDSDVEEVFKNFPRKYVQQVPKYSAVKVKGKELYKYAYAGLDVELPSREVELLELSLLSVNKLDNKVEVVFECEVSKGTYIRSLCNDIAKQLNTVAVMSNLVRVKQGSYTLDECQMLDDDIKLININDLVLPIEKQVLSDEEFNDVRYGRTIANNKNVVGFVGLYYEDELVAIYESSEKVLKSKRGIKVWK